MKSTNKLGKTLLGAGLAVALGFAITAGNQALAQTWTEITPSAGPAPGGRNNHTAVYDPATNQMIVFAGAFGVPHFNDLWSLSDANGIGAPAWTQLAPSGGPPAPRFVHKASYDAANDRMIVFGGGKGFSSPCTREVWVLSNASRAAGPTPTWTQLAPVGPAGFPIARFSHAQVYDPGTNSLIIFGGSNCASLGSFNDVWVLSNANGLGGAPTWTQLFPSGVILAHNRDSHSAVVLPAFHQSPAGSNATNGRVAAE